MLTFTVEVPLPPDFDTSDWQAVSGAVGLAADLAADLAAGSTGAVVLGVPEVTDPIRGSKSLIVEVEAPDRTQAWSAARRLEDGLRQHGVEWAGRSRLHGEDDVDARATLDLHAAED